VPCRAVRTRRGGDLFRISLFWNLTSSSWNAIHHSPHVLPPHRHSCSAPLRVQSKAGRRGDRFPILLPPVGPTSTRGPTRGQSSAVRVGRVPRTAADRRTYTFPRLPRVGVRRCRGRKVKSSRGRVGDVGRLRPRAPARPGRVASRRPRSPRFLLRFRLSFAYAFLSDRGSARARARRRNRVGSV
jgi:hypothetical protein